MAKFVYLVNFFSNSGRFDEVKDTKRLNDILAKLQHNNAVIISVTPSVAPVAAAVSSIYIITYEAPAPIEI